MNSPFFLKSILLLSPFVLAPLEHEDPQLGFKIDVPKDWKEIALATNERHLVGKYESDRKYYYTDKTFGYTMENRPSMTMIAFGEKSDSSGPVTGKVDGEKNNVVRITYKNPYDDYLDYLRKKTSGAGWFVDSEETVEVRGIEATAYDIKIEKSSNAPMRVNAWVYHLPGVDIAVEFILFESVYPKLKRSLNKSFKSFKVIERTETRDKSTELLEVDWGDDTPQDRMKTRKAVEENQRKKAQENLPEDWIVKEMSRYLVLNHADKKHAKKVVNQVDAMFKWLDKTFPYVNPEEYVRAPIIRICANVEEERSFQRGSSWSFTNIEILTHKSTAGASSFEWGYLNWRAMSFWFSDKDRSLWRNLPTWLKLGLDGMSRYGGTLKGSKMQFAATSYENESIRESFRQESVLLPSELIRLPVGKFRNVPRGSSLLWECVSFTRWLLEGPGAKSKLTKGLAEEIILHAQVVLEERAAKEKKEKEEDDDEEAEPMTEEEEDAAFEADSNKWEVRTQAFVDEVFRRTFEDWSEKDWASLDKTYMKYLK